eukprot:6810714-Lingulodinium_polyedra.AAC.1
MQAGVEEFLGRFDLSARSRRRCTDPRPVMSWSTCGVTLDCSSDAEVLQLFDSAGSYDSALLDLQNHWVLFPPQSSATRPAGSSDGPPGFP